MTLPIDNNDRDAEAKKKAKAAEEEELERASEETRKAILKKKLESEIVEFLELAKILATMTNKYRDKIEPSRIRDLIMTTAIPMILEMRASLESSVENELKKLVDSESGSSLPPKAPDKDSTTTEEAANTTVENNKPTAN